MITQSQKTTARSGHGAHPVMLLILLPFLAFVVCCTGISQLLRRLGVPAGDADGLAALVTLGLLALGGWILQRRKRRKEAARRRKRLALSLGFLTAGLGLIVLGFMWLFRGRRGRTELPPPSSRPAGEIPAEPRPSPGPAGKIPAFPTALATTADPVSTPTESAGAARMDTSAPPAADSGLARWFGYLGRVAARATWESLFMLCAGGVFGLALTLVALSVNLWDFTGPWAQYAKWGVSLLTVFAFAAGGFYCGVWSGVGKELKRIVRETTEIQHLFDRICPRFAQAARDTGAGAGIAGVVPLDRWLDSLDSELDRLDEFSARERTAMKGAARVETSLARKVQGFFTTELASGVTVEALLRSEGGDRLQIDFGKIEKAGIEALKNYLVKQIDSRVSAVRVNACLVAVAVVMVAYAVLKLVL